MRLFLSAGFVLLCVLFVLAPTNHASAEVLDGLASCNGTSALTAKNDDQEMNQVDSDVNTPVDETSTDDEVEETEAGTSTIEKKQRWKKRRMNADKQSRHHHHHKGKRPHHHKHRHHHRHHHQDEIKLYKKTKRTGIRYMERSPQTGHLNKVVDEMLVLFAQTLETDNVTLTLKKEHFQLNGTTLPWAFVVFHEKTSPTRTTNATESKKNSGRPAVSGIANKEDTAAVTEDDPEEDDDDNSEEDQKLSVTPDENPDTNIIAESSAPLEEVVATEDDDDDDDDDDDTDAITPGNNVTRQATTLRFNITDIYSPVSLPDGTVEYNLKLLSEEEIQQRKEVAQISKKKRDAEPAFNKVIQSDTSSDRGRNKMTRSFKKMKRKYTRSSGRLYPRKTRIQLKGIELIERIGDVLLGSRENSTNHVVDVQLQIGPIQFIINQATGLALQSRVTFPTLMARLRLTISEEGKLISARLKRRKIRPDEVIVTLRSKEEDNIATSLEAARLTTYLSHGTTSVWNSGYLLRRLKRQFKSLFDIRMKDDKKQAAIKKTGMNYEEVQKLLQSLALLTSDQQQPSTVTPMIIESVTILPSS